jgi:predicted metal-dependent hydrolase
MEHKTDNSDELAGQLEDFLAGIQEFNAGLFYQCHETLEKVWRNQNSEKRQFTQGIIQLAVAYHHLENHNEVGAIKLFKRALPRLIKFGPVCLGVEANPLFDQTERTLVALESASESSIQADSNDLENILRHPPEIKLRP